VVELHRLPEGEPRGEGAEVPGLEGRWRPVPVEYKRGKPKDRRCDEIQLCAQALCLEEMLAVPIARGAVYHHASRRRRIVEFTDELRELVDRTTAQVRELLGGRRLPPALNDKRCRNCSLIDVCLPAAVQRGWQPYWRSLFQVEDKS
jgi:CRISPR-associated protein Cas4